MSPAVFFPLLIAIGIFLVPVWLLRNRQDEQTRQDTFVASGHMPPQAIRNASIAYSLRLVAFWPAFILGAAGQFSGVALGALCLGIGVYLLYALRRNLFPFLEEALEHDQSITVHAFVARSFDNDPRVQLAAACLTLFVLAAVIACEALVLSDIFGLALANGIVARGLTFGTVLLALLLAFPSGHPGVVYSGQLQLGAIFLGLFGTATFLLYQHVSALTPLPSYGVFAIAYCALFYLAILLYRRSRYIETGAIVPASRVAKLLSKFGKVLNPIISVLVVLVIVLAGMEFLGGPAANPNDAPAPIFPITLWPALVLLPLLYPLADVAQWQKLAAIEVNRKTYGEDVERWLTLLRENFRVYAAEIVLLWLFAASLGTLTVSALALSNNSDAMMLFAQEAASGDNPVVTAAFSLLLLALAAIALSTMATSFSAALCTIRYDVLPPGAESGSRASRLFFLVVLVALIAASEWLTTVGVLHLLALVFALVTPILPFAILILGPMLTSRRPSPNFTLAILASGAVSAAAGVGGYAITSNAAWLWAAAPLGLMLSFALYAMGCYGNRIR